MPYNASRVIRALRGGGAEGEDVVPPVNVSVIYRFTRRTVDALEEVKYGRENNPTVMRLERGLAAAEGAEWCLAFNSGMAALAAVLAALAPRGGRLLVSRLVYGSTRGLVEREARRTGGSYRAAGPPWGELLDEAGDADLVIVETMGNPTLRIPPLERLASRCRETGCRLVVDNTFATPYLYRPLEALGDDVIVVESLTKYIGGHNDLLGGAVCGSGREALEQVWEARRLQGSIIQPLDAYLAIRGLKTLHLRVERSSRSAARIASWLEESGLVAKVYYPGLPSHPDHEAAKRMLPGLYGGVVSFDTGSRERALRAMERLRLIVPAPSLGGVESVISYPYESSHRSLPPGEREELGITAGLLRLSVGLEEPGDLIGDLAQALRLQ